jgi:hypothetical protein
MFNCFTLGVLLAGATQLPAAQPGTRKASALLAETFEILFNLGQVYLQAPNIRS